MRYGVDIKIKTEDSRYKLHYGAEDKCFEDVFQRITGALRQHLDILNQTKGNKFKFSIDIFRYNELYDGSKFKEKF